jgi:imidazolonepropionase
MRGENTQAEPAVADREASRFVVDSIGCLVTMPVDVRQSPDDGGLGCITDAAVAVEKGRVQWAGRARDLPGEWAGIPTLSAEGRVVLPGFVDCHSHIVYGGDRVGDFCRRCQGESYAEILKAGGGIHTTVTGTRSATVDELLGSATGRLRRMRAFGTTTVEIKSGYGLDVENEIKILEVVRELGKREPQKILSTFLGAHIVPKEAASMGAYADLVIDEMLPRIYQQGLADFVDVFCAREAFDAESTHRILRSARDLGLGLKVHAEQLDRTGGAQVAARLGAVSADHLDWANQEDLDALARAGTIGVLLPSVALFTGADHYPSAKEFRSAGVTMALATDCNPGSSPAEDLSLVASLGCVQLGMTPAEALRAITVEAAKALGAQGEVGSVLPGARADLVFLNSDVEDPREIPYRMGSSRVEGVMVDGCFWCYGAGWSGEEGMPCPVMLAME